MPEKITGSMLEYILGAVTALLIPTMGFIYRTFIKWNDLRKVKKMIIQEYVEPLDKLTDQLNAKTRGKYDAEIGKTTQRLDYLLNNEIAYMNSENQFAIIRMLEYTKMYLQAVDNELKTYNYTGPEPTPPNPDLADKPRSLKKITENYKKTLNEYIKLERDHFPKE